MYQLGDRLGRTDYGLGILNSGQYSSTGQILRSTMYGDVYNHVARSRRAVRGSRATLNMPTPLLGSRYGSGDQEVIGPTPEAMEEPGERKKGESIAAIIANQYLDTIGANTSEAIAEKRAVTTLVPEVPGAYRDLMARGEQAMLGGEVHQAIDAFMEAKLLTYRNPDVLLSLAHGHFLLSRFSYVSASQYLQETLITLPELPLVQLEPKQFLGGADVYDARMARLEEHLRNQPDDPDALLLRAYFKWFEPDGTKAAVESLRKAWVASKAIKPIGSIGYDSIGSQVREAIEVFWTGMVKSGRASGSLAPTTRPAPTSRPAAATSMPAGK
jgi:hypothetical protein